MQVVLLANIITNPNAPSASLRKFSHFVVAYSDFEQIPVIEVRKGYKLKNEFNIDFEQFMVGIDKVA